MSITAVLVACLFLNGCVAQRPSMSDELALARQMLVSESGSEPAATHANNIQFAAHDVSFLEPGRISGVEWALLMLMVHGNRDDADLTKRFISSSCRNVRRCAVAGYLSILAKHGNVEASLPFLTDEDVEIRGIAHDIYLQRSTGDGAEK
ncbi:MAG: hypothetical protein ACOX5G_05400 [Kiritimatiellia bacterium]|jgi:hypothetical protein